MARNSQFEHINEGRIFNREPHEQKKGNGPGIRRCRAGQSRRTRGQCKLRSVRRLPELTLLKNDTIMIIDERLEYIDRVKKELDGHRPFPGNWRHV
jgi:hypothetical protein